ncbi:MAG: DUF1232 domain-containing protein [SAR202 cluster bacterium]|nr:DUF1232 domain-containing protein [SAR202 cluster bacterium]
MKRMREAARALRREVRVWRLVARHPRTPLAARLLLAFAVGYALLPFDLVPDFVPVLGVLDDVLLVGGPLLLALRLVPRDVIAECRGRA